MITLKDFMKVVDYRITEGSQFCWSCFGSNAYALDSWNGDGNGYSVSIVFDTKTQTVYQVSAYDYKREKAYRMINDEYKTAHEDERESRGVDDNAWDDVPYTDLEVDEDFMEKATAIVNDMDYDTDITIPLNLDNTTAMILFKGAHEANMTFNDYVNKILKEEFERISQMSKKELKQYKKQVKNAQG